MLNSVMPLFPEERQMSVLPQCTSIRRQEQDGAMSLFLLWDFIISE